jgi:hypothetical protein
MRLAEDEKRPGWRPDRDPHTVHERASTPCVAYVVDEDGYVGVPVDA